VGVPSATATDADRRARAGSHRGPVGTAPRARAGSGAIGVADAGAGRNLGQQFGRRYSC